MSTYTGNTNLVTVGWLHGAREGRRVYVNNGVWEFIQVNSTTSCLAEVKGSILDYILLFLKPFKRRDTWNTNFTKASRRKPVYLGTSPLR